MMKKKDAHQPAVQTALICYLFILNFLFAHLFIFNSLFACIGFIKMSRVSYILFYYFVRAHYDYYISFPLPSQLLLEIVILLFSFDRKFNMWSLKKG